MIRRVKKTCSLILLAATVTSIMSMGLMNTEANAAVNDLNIEAAKNESALAATESYDITKDEDAKKYIINEYSSSGCNFAVIQGPIKTLSITLTKSQIDIMVKKMKMEDNIDNLVKQLTVAAIMKQQKCGQEQAIKLMQNPNNAQMISAIKSKCKEELYNKIIQSCKSIPIYQYGALKVTSNGTQVTGKEVVGSGFIVGGNLAYLLKTAGKNPIIIDAANLDTKKIDQLKQKIIKSITENIDEFIKKAGIDSFVGDVTDAIKDLGDSLDDLADSLHDKSEDIDDAWDKVFDRFDNDEGWGERDGYIYYYDEDGVSLKGVQKIEGKTYYFNKIDGAMETGWQIVDGKRCYFDKKEGYQVFLQWVQDGDDWYFLNADGTTRKSEWINDNGKWYYVKADGKRAKGWLKIDDYWYYLNSENGVMASCQWILDDNNKWRYVKDNGAAANEWCFINGKWYYFKENTAEMQSGWFRANGSWYYADSNGAMQTGWVSCKDGWSYLDDSTGKMKKNEWAYSNGKWYYFNINGIMVTGKRYIDGTKYTFNSDGSLA
ncbi:MAG: N-acetylmuramoyl-L-alanine amidase family protein [Clostridium butyricum]|nr:N-acetylmuramoyl-L-alanine amidase family protein [Clostridium butyricum]